MSRIFKCYSNKLKNFLLENGIKYEEVVKDINNDKTIWLYIKDESFDKAMKLYK